MAKVMIVEDDNNLRAIYGDRLLAEGYEVVSASDGEEALAIAVKEKPDLIISDVMMPKISGFDMLDILRSTPETKDTKVIMMTALSQAEDKDRADKLGADKYLVKSQVTLDDVARVVNEVIAGPGVAASASQAATPAAAPAVAPVSTPEPFVPTPAPAMPTPPAPVVEAPVAAPAEPVMPVAAEPASNPVAVPAPMPEPVAMPEPALVTPLLSEPVADPVVATADEVTADAEDEQEEKAQISAEIDNFIATNDSEPVAGVPATTPSAQEHAMNALQSTPPDEPVVEAPVATPPPEVEKESVDNSKKVIEPLPVDANKPNIYDLYEKEMANEAAQVNASTEASKFVETPVAEPAPAAAPTTPPDVVPEPSAQPAAPAVTHVDMPVAQPPADDTGHVPHPDDPSAIAL